MLSLYCRTQNTLFRFICSAKDFFTFTSNKFRMVCKVDVNPQLDSRDWSMYFNILNTIYFYVKIGGPSWGKKRVLSANIKLRCKKFTKRSKACP